jgi:hypothetical protein
MSEPRISEPSFGLVDGRPVFMDEQTDCYFRLDALAEAELLQQLAEDSPGTQTPRHLAEAVGTSRFADLQPAQCKRPDRSLLDPDCAAKPSLAEIAKIALIVTTTKRALARRPIARILTDLQAGDVSAHLQCPDRQLRRAARFAAARRLIPSATNCLLDSIALLRWLGVDARGACLVFGVTLDPFAAHCWVQTDSILLNDRPDQAGRFEPVRVIRCSVPTH